MDIQQLTNFKKEINERIEKYLSSNNDPQETKFLNQIMAYYERLQQVYSIKESDDDDVLSMESIEEGDTSYYVENPIGYRDQYDTNDYFEENSYYHDHFENDPTDYTDIMKNRIYSNDDIGNHLTDFEENMERRLLGLSTKIDYPKKYVIQGNTSTKSFFENNKKKWMSPYVSDILTNKTMMYDYSELTV